MSTYKYEYGVKFALDFNNFITHRPFCVCYSFVLFVLFALIIFSLSLCAFFSIEHNITVFVGVVVCAKIIPLIRTR